MAELLTDTLLSLNYIAEDYSPSHKQKPKEVTDMLDWVQCFGVYVAIISFKEPNRIPDLIGYQFNPHFIVKKDVGLCTTDASS